MRKTLLLIAVILTSFFSFGGKITKQQASRVAINFYFERVNISRSLEMNEISISQITPIGNTEPFYFVCNMQPEGFVIVSAYDNIIPVLAYSFERYYSEESSLPPGFSTWMNHYKDQISYAVSNQIVAQQEISDEWNRLLDNNFNNRNDSRLLDGVEPLLISKWNQDSPYNNLCPLDPAGPGGRCYAGCVATAMGQLLYYYRFPQQGLGSYSYTHPDYGTISADFGATTYDWNLMPSVVSKANNAVGQLLFHQGVSVDMDYGPDGSGMWNHKAAFSLKNHFRYGPETQYYFRDSVSIDWDSLIITNLNQRKPLYYAGWAGVQSTSGHAFVCDGYQTGNYYHFNWGWGGSQDGYFYTANLTPGGNNFNFAQEIIPMFPDTIQNSYPNYCQGFTNLTALRGSVEDGSGWYNYADNASCSWLISPQDIEYDSIKNIKITFLKFDTQANADTLYIYDGEDDSAPLIGAYSGSIIPATFTTSGNKVFLRFISNATITKGGWQLDYESLFPVYCSGITTLTAPNGSIEDGSGDKKYSSNSMCRWKITPAGEMPVSFYFTSLETYDSIDIVKIYDLQTQEVLGTFSGNQLPPVVTANSGKMLILFMTNSTGNADGFSGEYYSSGVGIQLPDTCLKETLIYPNPGNGQITIEKYFFVSSEHNINIRVFTVNNEMIYSKTIKVRNGINKIEMNIPNIPAAPYFLIIDDGDKKEVRTIIIGE